jgi:hypothetical protein
MRHVIQPDVRVIVPAIGNTVTNKHNTVTCFKRRYLLRIRRRKNTDAAYQHPKQLVHNLSRPFLFNRFYTAYPAAAATIFMPMVSPDFTGLMIFL